MYLLALIYAMRVVYDSNYEPLCVCVFLFFLPFKEYRERVQSELEATPEAEYHEPAKGERSFRVSHSQVKFFMPKWKKQWSPAFSRKILCVYEQMSIMKYVAKSFCSSQGYNV